jgi:kynureninase
MPKKAMAQAQQTVVNEWGSDLIKSWNKHDWFTLAQRLGDRLAPLIGAGEGEVVVTDSTGINLFKVLAAALMLSADLHQQERTKIVMEGSNFPTDNYTAQGLLKLLGDRHEIVFAEEEGILEAIDETVAVVCLTQVHYKTGRVLDMQAITQKTQACGAVSVWDLCHSAGAIPVDLNGCNVDFAVGCTYKYLNGGPGSPAFIFTAKRHQGKALQPLTGWWGHAAPFAFDRDYTPAGNINQMLSGTQPIVSLAVTEVGLDISCRADIELVRRKSQQLGDLFIQLLAQECGQWQFDIVSPRDAERRGSQVSIAHDNGYAIMQALIDRGVIGDFRAPDIMRFGFSALYVSFADVFDTVATLKDIMTTGCWQDEQYNRRNAVT